MQTIERSVEIERPVTEVFEFFEDFRNLPKFLGDVMEVELTGPKTSRWTIQGPLGMTTHWTMVVTEKEADRLIGYQTETTPALVTRWQVRFEGGAGGTTVRESLRMPLGEVSAVALALIGKHPAAEVSSNLQRLKELLETGRVRTTENAVRGKFEQAT